MKEADAQKNPNRRLRIFLTVAILAVVAFCGYSYYWAQEERKTFHRTKDLSYAMIETEFYSLKVPAEWLRYVTVEIAPVNEVYGGWEDNGQEQIHEDNYQVQLSYKTGSGTYPVANIAMYKYLNDCLEQLDNWKYWGELTTGRSKIAKIYSYSYETMDFNWVSLIVNYAAEPTGLPAEELTVWRAVQDTLSADMLQCKSDGDQRYAKFSENSTGNPHGTARTWDEALQDDRELDRKLAELDRKLAELEKEKKEKEAQSSGSKKTASATQSSSSKTCIYPGCRNRSVSNKKGYCNKHYRQLYETRDDFYDEDPESYYQDNKSMYQSRSEAYDDWEDEYEED